MVDPASLVPAEGVLDGDLLEDGPGVPLAYCVLLAVEDPLVVPAEVVLDPHFPV